MTLLTRALRQIEKQASMVATTQTPSPVREPRQDFDLVASEQATHPNCEALRIPTIRTRKRITRHTGKVFAMIQPASSEPFVIERTKSIIKQLSGTELKSTLFVRAELAQDRSIQEDSTASVLQSAKNSFRQAAKFEKSAKNARSWISYTESEQARLQQLQESLDQLNRAKERAAERAAS